MRLASARQRMNRLRAGDDTGLTLLEVVVSMTIMLVLMSIFTAGIVQMYRTSNKTEALSTAQSQMHIAFQRLDREIRYASAISTEGTVGSDWYVEYLSTNNGKERCTELRLQVGTAQLQRRTWDSGATPGAWGVLAANVRSSSPFTVDHNGNFQRLRLQLAAASGSPSNPDTAAIDFTFTALNTVRGTGTPDVCAEGRTTP